MLRIWQGQGRTDKGDEKEHLNFSYFHNHSLRWSRAKEQMISKKKNTPEENKNLLYTTH